MKRLLFMVLGAALLASCASSCATTTNAQLTQKNVVDTCKQPVESWQVRVMPMAVLVLRYQNCGGVNDLLVMSTPTDGFSEVKRELTAQLSKIYYLDYLERQEPKDGESWKAKLVNREVIPDANNPANAQEVFYYELVRSAK